MKTEISSILERKARIFNVQKYSIYDGPGIRTLIFFKGCPLRCKWCSNPEGLERKYQVMYQEDLCIHCGSCISVCPAEIHYISNQSHKVSRSKECVGCRRCEDICPKKALAIAGQDKTISEVLAIIEQDSVFYSTSGGGVTLGGGEATSQPEFAVHLLTECKRLGIHTAIETCGYAKPEVLQKIARFTDLFLYDIKHIDPDRHYELTGVRNERILDNLSTLIRQGYHVKIRMPLLKGINDDQAALIQTMEYLKPFQRYKNFQGVDLLPYHRLGINKYKQLGMEYSFSQDLSLSQGELEQIKDSLKAYDLKISILQH